MEPCGESTLALDKLWWLWLRSLGGHRCAIDDERDVLPESGRSLPLTAEPFPFTLALCGTRSATSPSMSFVISRCRFCSFRARVSCFSASSSLRASSSLSSSSSLESSSPPSAPSDDDPARDDGGESLCIADECIRLEPCSVRVDEDDTFFVGRGYALLGWADSGLWTWSVPVGDLICARVRPCACPRELRRARTPRAGRRVLVPGTVPDAEAATPVAEEEDPRRARAESWLD